MKRSGKVSLAFWAAVWYNVNTEQLDVPFSFPQAKRPPGDWYSPGGPFAGTGLLALLVPAAPVKPLADVVGRYARCDRHQKSEQMLHHVSPLPVASIEGQQKEHTTV